MKRACARCSRLLVLRGPGRRGLQFAAGSRAGRGAGAAEGDDREGAPRGDSRRFPRPSPRKPATPSDAQVTLGRMLYYEPRLSKSQTISVQHLPRPLELRGRPRADLHRAQGPEGRPQLADGVQRRRPLRAVLGRPRGRRRGAGQGAGAEPGGDGDAEREDGRRGARVDARVRGPASRRRSRTTSSPVTYDNMAKAIGAFERQADDAVALGRAAERRRVRADAGGDGRPQDVPRDRLPGLPLRRAARRHLVPEARGGQSVSGRRPTPGASR